MLSLTHKSCLYHISYDINNSWSEGPKYSAVKMHLSEITGPLCHISADYCEIQPNGAAVNMIMTVFMV